MAFIFFNVIYLFIFCCATWLRSVFLAAPVACGILVPRPGIEPRPLAVKAPSPNHQTAREYPTGFLYILCFYSS